MARMAEFEGANCGVVRLEDGLEVEGQAVPQRKLATRGAGEDASCFGSPLKSRKGEYMCV